MPASGAYNKGVAGDRSVSVSCLIVSAWFYGSLTEISLCPDPYSSTFVRASPQDDHTDTQGFCQLSDEAAATVSAILTVIRGPGAQGTTPAECKNCTPAILADMNEVTRPYQALQFAEDTGDVGRHHTSVSSICGGTRTATLPHSYVARLAEPLLCCVCHDDHAVVGSHAT